LPAHAPPADFEDAVLEREARLLAELPVRHRVGRLVSMLAGYAMRPQLVMGALLLLMIGSSLMFVRTRPSSHSAVQVTERGAPEADVDVVLPLTPPPLAEPPAPSNAAASNPLPLPVTELPAASAPAPARALEENAASHAAVADAGNDSLDPFEQAMQIYRARSYLEAQHAFERVGRSGGKRTAEAALYAALSLRNYAGCAPALAAFERLQTRYAGAATAHEAAWRQARCQEQLGDTASARRGYEALLNVPSHARRAERALAALPVSEPPTAAQ
jgi:TolA-binding protein